jgi:hypothetical protein
VDRKQWETSLDASVGVMAAIEGFDAQMPELKGSRVTVNLLDLQAAALSSSRRVRYTSFFR